MKPERKKRRAPMMSARLDWPSVIGHFILAFGTLEYDIFLFLEKHATPEELEKSRTLHFKDRMGIVAMCLTRAGVLPEDQDAFSKFSDQLDTVRELRNLIAHGHFGMVKEEGKALQVTISLPRDFDKPYDPETRRVDFDELFDKLQVLYKATEEFGHLTKRGEGSISQHYTLMGEGPDQHWEKTPLPPPEESP